MNEWRQASDAGGLPIWSGTDSIYNMGKEKRRWAGGYGAGLLFSGAFLVWIGGLLSKTGLDGAGGFLSGLGLLTLVAGVAFLLYAFAAPKLIKAEWTLRVSQDGGFEYSGTPWGESRTQWSIPAERIARVESGATREWVGERRFGFKPLPIREHEFQAYLFLDDGRRLVVATIDHGREATGSLAQSIRTWIETYSRSAKPAARPDGPAPGFDI